MAISPAPRGISLILRRCSVHLSTPLAGSPTRRRGKNSLLIRRDATLRVSGALHLTFFEQPEKDGWKNSRLLKKTGPPTSCVCEIPFPVRSNFLVGNA